MHEDVAHWGFALIGALMDCTGLTDSPLFLSALCSEKTVGDSSKLRSLLEEAATLHVPPKGAVAADMEAATEEGGIGAMVRVP
jgi:hypothetical protein